MKIGTKLLSGVATATLALSLLGAPAAQAAPAVTNTASSAPRIGGGYIPNPHPGNPWICALYLSGVLGPINVPGYVKYCTW